jgi:exodeoxyribonuclease VIII
MIYAPGFYDLTREQYDAAEGIRNSDLKWAARSMKHYKHFKEHGGDEQTEAQREGQLIHRAILEPDWFFESTIVLPEDAPRRPTRIQREAKKPSKETIEAIAWWDNWNAGCKGREVIEHELSERIKQMLDEITNDPEAGPILSSIKRREVAAFSRHDSTGLLLKSSIDLLPDDGETLYDIKTTNDSEPEKFKRHVNDFGYHRQAAFYLDQCRRLGRQFTRFALIIVETEAPFVVSVREIDQDSIEIGRREYNALLHNIAACQRTNNYPGYQADETGLPIWRLKEVL